MQIKSRKDFVSGLMFMGFGAAFSLGAFNYTVGNAARMGPGYFPMLLGALLAGMGAFVLLGSFRSQRADGGRIGAIAWKPLLYIVGANLAFGVLLGGVPSLGIPAMGLIAAIFAAVIISSMAGSRYVFRGSLILAVILAIGSYLTFVMGLSLQFQVWPTFITG
ncbi:tripartite tricarboxylate transporter TctB family protein [Pseudorhodoferax soli]|uniref:Tripartite tricarboxylate transporter TctB family protein n=1 Tax=Pseudorhodoferax soli TaxID=545864 RepID=A0A368XH21_9BURK|nr:tripartite tricarboxylate transporter TctB family protein [Pseudorhodoferax soli]RCW67301.1 tripartite tricarboxylate transporter TctB family protein [Pseudorhodoferax soli]